MSLPPRDLALYGRRLVAERMTASGPSSLWTAETVPRFSILARRRPQPSRAGEGAPVAELIAERRVGHVVRGESEALDVELRLAVRRLDAADRGVLTTQGHDAERFSRSWRRQAHR